MSALLTYALNKEKVLVNIDDVAKGGACHCVCPQCGNPLIAKNGGLNPNRSLEIWYVYFSNDRH